MSDQQKELATIVALHKAILDEVRMSYILKYTEDCDCASCLRNRTDAAEKHEQAKAIAVKALADVRAFIEENDTAVQLVKLIGETKKIIKSTPATA